MTNVKSPKHPLSCDSRPTTTGRLGTSLDGGSNMSSSFHMRGDRKAGEKASCALRSVRWPWRAACAIAADMRALRGDMRPDMSSPPRLLATLRTDGACSDRSPPPSSCAPPPAAAAACSPVASSSAPRCSGSSVFSSSMALPFSASPPPPCPSAPPVLFVEGGKKKWKFLLVVPYSGPWGSRIRPFSFLPPVSCLWDCWSRARSKRGLRQRRPCRRGRRERRCERRHGFHHARYGRARRDLRGAAHGAGTRDKPGKPGKPGSEVQRFGAAARGLIAAEKAHSGPARVPDVPATCFHARVPVSPRSAPRAGCFMIDS